MRPPKYSIAAAVLSALVTLGALHHLRSAELSELGQLRHLNAKMQYHAYEREQADLATAIPETPPPRAVSAAPQAPVGYRNEGQSTPQAAVQTFAWACERGDTAAVAVLIYLDQDQRRQAESFMATLPEERRSRWQSVEEMAAELFILSSLARPLPAADVLAAAPVETTGDDRATILTPHPIQLRKVDGAWKYQVSASVIENLGQQIFSTLGKSPAP
jgi:hypothetical protein